MCGFFFLDSEVDTCYFRVHGRDFDDEDNFGRNY